MRLNWLYIKIKVKKVSIFPIAMIVLVLLPLFPLIFSSIGVDLGFSQIPFLKGAMEKLGMYSDRDLFVNTTWVIWWPLFIVSIFFFRRIWCGGFCPFGLVTDIGNWIGKKLRKGKIPTAINVAKYVFISFF